MLLTLLSSFLKSSTFWKSNGDAAYPCLKALKCETNIDFVEKENLLWRMMQKRHSLIALAKICLSNT